MKGWIAFPCIVLLGLTTNMATGQDTSLRFVRITDNTLCMELIADGTVGAWKTSFDQDCDTELAEASVTVSTSNANNSVYGKMDVISAVTPSPQPIASVSTIHNSTWDVDTDTFGYLVVETFYNLSTQEWWVDSINNQVPAETEVPIIGTVTIASVGGNVGDPLSRLGQDGRWLVQYKGKRILEAEMTPETPSSSPELTVRYYDANGDLEDEFDVPWDWESDEADIPFTFMAEVADAPPTGEFITVKFFSRVVLVGSGTTYPYTSTGGNIFESAVHMEFAPTP